VIARVGAASRTILLVLLAIVHALPPVLAQSGEASASDSTSAKVTYVTSSTVYIDVGRDDGLRPGDTVEVLRDGRVVTTLTVDELSNHRATCRRVEGTVEIRVGDAVRYTSRTREPAAAATPVADAGTRVDPSRRTGIRGRVGLQFLTVQNRDSDVASFSQPGLSLWLQGDRIGGSGVDAIVDVRARRTTRTTTGDVDPLDTQTRVYRFAVGYQAPDGISVRLGRQYSPSLANVSTFDGALVRVDRRRWSVGGFAGTQPDPIDFAYATDIREYGAFAQFRGSPESRNRWSVGLGAVGSYEQSEINREFVFVQFRFIGPKLFAFGVQEVDVNRDWKGEIEDQSVAPTNTFLSLRYNVSRRFGVVAGYDNRRNIRLFRDRVTPETEFDDTFRRGVWVGAFLQTGQRTRIDFATRQNSGGSAGDAATYTGSVGIGPYGPKGLLLRFRGSRFSNDDTEGWLASTFVGFNLVGRIHLGFDGGIRDDRLVADTDLSAPLVWYGLELDVPLGQRWFYMITLERTNGDLEQIDQLYTLLTYRF
jgi:hypothetical protein